MKNDLVPNTKSAEALGEHDPSAISTTNILLENVTHSEVDRQPHRLALSHWSESSIEFHSYVEFNE